MTAQIPDLVHFRDQEFVLCGVNGGPLLEPEQFGLNPASPCTACYRGWCAEYQVAEGIQVHKLYVFHDAGLPVKNRRPNGPDINGVAAQKPKSRLSFFNCLYENLNLPLAFTGGLLIAADRAPGLYRNMGFPKFYLFEKVYELSFENGQLLSAVDKSEVAAKIRTQHLKSGILGFPQVDDDAAVQAWIAESFSLQYGGL